MFEYVIGIDPGNELSGYCIIDNSYNIIEADKVLNEKFIEILKLYTKDYTDKYKIVIESIQSYGLTMGASIIGTCYFIGRLIQICRDNSLDFSLIPRPEYGKAITGTNKVSDTLIRSALELRFGSYSKGKKEIKLKSGKIKQEATQDGPLVKLSGCTDIRSAFGVACYWLDLQRVKNAGS